MGWCFMETRPKKHGFFRENYRVDGTAPDVDAGKLFVVLTSEDSCPSWTVAPADVDAPGSEMDAIFC
jgi:hypothetical protein